MGRRSRETLLVASEAPKVTMATGGIINLRHGGRRGLKFTERSQRTIMRVDIPDRNLTRPPATPDQKPGSPAGFPLRGS
ncbi:hypothetical protein MPLA_940004 [Mesorhizobium sp. ORS 3359]|nr:hypothetical protein MPLA_940004 [Mesorhizobium sp. ORS 3359]